MKIQIFAPVFHCFVFEKVVFYYFQNITAKVWQFRDHNMNTLTPSKNGEHVSVSGFFGSKNGELDNLIHLQEEQIKWIIGIWNLQIDLCKGAFKYRARLFGTPGDPPLPPREKRDFCQTPPLGAINARFLTTPFSMRISVNFEVITTQSE